MNVTGLRGSAAASHLFLCGQEKVIQKKANSLRRPFEIPSSVPIRRGLRKRPDSLHNPQAAAELEQCSPKPAA